MRPGCAIAQARAVGAARNSLAESPSLLRARSHPLAVPARRPGLAQLRFDDIQEVDSDED